jgi:ornithine cyclodeaminase/alanine dehydrogenase-like protein (mu-crystallin family)
MVVRYLDEASVRAVLRWDPLIAAMESALGAFSSGQVIQPVRNMLTIEEGKRYLGIMPAVMQEAMGVKLVSFYPGNAGAGLPTHFGIILLSRSDTGEPLAVMDGRLITEMQHGCSLGRGHKAPCGAGNSRSRSARKWRASERSLERFIAGPPI